MGNFYKLYHDKMHADIILVIMIMSSTRDTEMYVRVVTSRFIFTLGTLVHNSVTKEPEVCLQHLKLSSDGRKPP